MIEHSASLNQVHNYNPIMKHPLSLHDYFHRCFERWSHCFFVNVDVSLTGHSKCASVIYQQGVPFILPGSALSHFNCSQINICISPSLNCHVALQAIIFCLQLPWENLIGMYKCTVRSCGHGDTVVFLQLCAAVCYVKLGEYNISKCNKHDKVNIHQDKVNYNKMWSNRDFKHALWRKTAAKVYIQHFTDINFMYFVFYML